MQTCLQKRILSTVRTGQADASGASRRGRMAGAELVEAVPCLFNNNSIAAKNQPVSGEKEDPNKGNHQKAATAAYLNISNFINPGSGAKTIEEIDSLKCPDNIAFLTLTLPGRVKDPKEFQRRFNSLRTNVLAPRYGKDNIVTVVEAHKSGALHVHILLRLTWTIRTAGNLLATMLYLQADKTKNPKIAAKLRNRAARQADKRLRQEWKYLRQVLGAYSFGRHRLEPVRGSASGMARYCVKYVTKGMDNRPEHLKGARLLRFPSMYRVAYTAFSWNTPAGKVWRDKLAALARAGSLISGQNIKSVQDITSVFGRSWCFQHRDKIELIRLGDYVTLEGFVGDRPRDNRRCERIRYEAAEVAKVMIK